MIFSNFNGTKSGGPLSWGTRLMEKVILGVAGAVQSAVFTGKWNLSRIAQLCTNQSIAARKTCFKHFFHAAP